MTGDQLKFFGDLIFHIRRKRLKLSQAELAKQLGIYPLTIWKWENYEVEPSQRFLMMLWDYLQELIKAGKLTLTEEEKKFFREITSVEIIDIV